MRAAAFIVAVLAGIAQAGSIAAPWSGQPQWWLQLASLAVLAFLLQRSPTWKHAALLTGLFATAWLAGTWWWLFISMHVYGGLASPLAASAVLLLAAFLSLDYAIALAAWWFTRPRALAWQAIAFAGAWMLAELMRASLFTGFPWGAGGYAHVDGPLAILAPWVGVYGMAAVAALLAFLLAAVRERQALVGLVLATALLAIGNLAPKRDDGAAQGRLSVALLQGNVPQDEKFQPGSGIPLALQWYATQLQASQAALTVTPETAIPLLPLQLPEGYERSIAQPFASGDRAALIGIPLGSFEQGYSNSVVGLKPGAAAYRYDKHHLVPFGEFIPPLFRWFVQLMNIPLGDFARGSLTQPAFEWKGERLAPNICYEDLFAEDLALRFTDPQHAPTIFVNMSNIAWFGDSLAIDQHLAISRLRAIEFDRPVIRATNTGATAIIDHLGRVTHALPRMTRGVLTGEVEGRSTMTFYVAWLSRFGLWPLWLAGLAALLIPIVRRRGHPAQ